MNSTIMKLHSKYSKISTKERFRTSNFFKKTKFRSPVFRYQKSSIWSSTRFLEKHGWFLEMAILVLHSPPVRSLPPSMFHHQPWMVSSNFTNTWGGYWISLWSNSWLIYPVSAYHCAELFVMSFWKESQLMWERELKILGGLNTFSITMMAVEPSVTCSGLIGYPWADYLY